MTREEQKNKLISEIKIRYKKLKALNYYLSDRYSVICLFDDDMFGKDFSDLTEDEQSASVVDQLI